MDPQEQSQYLEVQPTSTVSFDYIPKRYLLSSIQLKNAGSELAAFKIRTNAPFSYLVKPRLGFVQPNQTVDLSITMQPTDYDPHTTTINDKFLLNAYPVDSAIVRAKGSGSGCLKEIFEKTPQALVQTHKLNVNLKFESLGIHEDSLDTKDASGNESSPGRSSSQGNNSFQTSLSELSEKQNSEGNYEEILSQGNITPKTGTSPSYPFDRLTKSQSSNEINMTSLLDKVSMLERQGSETMLSSRLASTKKREHLMGMNEHKNLFAQVLQERDKLKEHLEKVKKSEIEVKNSPKVIPEIKAKGDYRLWHLLLVAVLGLLLGAMLKLK